MIRFIVLNVLLLELGVTSCFSQNDWKNGYIIKVQGDTIHGFINNRNSKNNSKLCYFRNEEKGETQILTPEDILGYRFVDGKFFISKSIEGLELGIPVFLEFLVKGKVNVYHYKNEKDIYYAEKDGKIYELKNTKKIANINNVDYFRENKEYIGLLTALFVDADMQKDIQQSKLQIHSLISIAKEYHDKVCTDEQCIVYEKREKPIDVNYSVYAGLSLNTINFGGDTKSNISSGSLLGCRFEFENMLEWQDNVNFAVDLTLQYFANYRLSEINNHCSSPITYNGVSYILGQSSINGISQLDVNIKTFALKVPITINYIFSKRDFRPYAGFGLINMFVLSQNKNFIYQRYYEKFNRSIPFHNIGFVGKVGCKHMLKNNKAILLEFNFEITNSFYVTKTYRLINNLMSITTGYTF
jgi:hypothetical protein